MKTNNKRRNFLKILSLGTVFAVSPKSLKAASIKHIVIIGAGFSGATCAKYLKMWAGSSVKVTLVDTNSTYVSPILSNLVLNGQKSTSNLSYTYISYASKYDINFVNKKVTAIDSSAKNITYEDNSVATYDKLILASGIAFDAVTGHDDFSKVPHAWSEAQGEQLNILKSQIDTMTNNDVFVMTIPKSPYRCPPGPYERACVVADYLKNKKGLSGHQVIVLDANADITVEKATFETAFALHGVTYVNNAIISSVDDSAKSVTYIRNGVSSTQPAKVLNVIPNQKASSLIFAAGVNTGNWAPVNPLNYESTLKSDIHIIGDSQGTAQPKAGHIGNSEAKVCADAILREFDGMAPYDSPKTNSACYSPTSSNSASWLTAVYKYDATSKNMVFSDARYPSSGASSKSNYKKMFLWSGNLFADTFK